MPWLKQVGCECEECGPDPCTSGCETFCNLSLDTAGGESGYDQTFDVTGDFGSARNIFIDFEAFTIKDQLLIDANGVNIYDSGCIGGNVTPTVLVPAATTSARVRIIPHCDPLQEGATAWTLTITCE